MSETSEQASPREVRNENPVVGAARGAVRTALETNESYQNWRNGISVKDIKKESVYRMWMNSADRVVGAMTAIDRKKLSTKLYQIKMGVAAATFGVVSPALDLAVNVLSYIPRKAVAGIGWSAIMMGFGPFGTAAVLAAKGGDKLAEAGVTRMAGKVFAEKHSQVRITKYKIAEGLNMVRHGKEFVADTAKNILTGFAYPEGRPPKPVMK